MSLIQRLEQLTGPDREVDAEISCLVKFKDLRPSRPDDFAGKYGYHPGDLKCKDGFIQSCCYTALIDAALTLVPDGWSFGLWGKREVIDCELFLRNTNTVVSVHDAVSEPIAICIAALKARGVK